MSAHTFTRGDLVQTWAGNLRLIVQVGVSGGRIMVDNGRGELEMTTADELLPLVPPQNFAGSLRMPRVPQGGRMLQEKI